MGADVGKGGVGGGRYTLGEAWVGLVAGEGGGDLRDKVVGFVPVAEVDPVDLRFGGGAGWCRLLSPPVGAKCRFNFCINRSVVRVNTLFCDARVLAFLPIFLFHDNEIRSIEFIV